MSLRLDIDPVELLSVAASIAIAFLLQYFIASRASNVRVEKDLLIKDVEEAISRLRQTNERFLQCLASKRITKADFDYLKASCRSLANAIEFVDISIQKAEMSGLRVNQAQLTASYYAYKATVTDISPQRSYAPDAHGEGKRAYQSLIAELRSLIFSINRC